MGESSFTLRFADDVGMRIATRSIGTVLTAVRAPRVVVDDVRLAVEMTLWAWIDRPDPPTATDDEGASDVGRARECVLAVACRAGRIGVETRLPVRVDLDRGALLALVDEVDVRYEPDVTTVGLARSWFAPRGRDVELA